MNGWVGRTLNVLLKERIVIRRQRMATLIAIDGRLERANKNRLFDATIMPILIARGKNRKVSAPEVVVVVTGMPPLQQYNFYSNISISSALE